MHDRVTQIHAKPQLSPQQLASFANALGAVVNSCIDVLNVIAGDPDTEDCTGAEDAFEPLGILVNDPGPGDPVGDPGDVAWIEWDRMRGSQKGGPNLTGNLAGRLNEDDEDDDSPEDNGDTELNGDEGDYGGEVDGV